MTENAGFFTVHFDGKKVSMLDQRLLPEREVYHEYTRYEDVAASITDMVVRGAPAIGITAAFGIALGAQSIQESDASGFESPFMKMLDIFAATRPTAVNLFWAIDRMRRVFADNRHLPVSEIQSRLVAEAMKVYEDDIEICRMIGVHGGELIGENASVLTHCNAGALATSEHGTALSVIRAAFKKGKKLKVYADETRPYLQGARLTAWELNKDGIPVTVICDNMAGYLMSKGMIDFIVTGADRIAANGDTANKIGTYSVAVLAKYHNVPFYIAAPLSTIDRNTATGAGIPIEVRGDAEMTHFNSKRIVPENVPVCNPSFDVTPAGLIAGIITEKGVVRHPYDISIAELFTR